MMNTYPRLLTLCSMLIGMLALTACQTTPFYRPALPQIADHAPDTISEDELKIPTNALKKQAPADLPPVKIGLLLPLSGKHQNLGQSMLKAAQMALFDLNHSNFEIIPRDTQGNPQIAKDAARSAIDEGAQILLGPVFANAAKSVQIVAQSNRVNMITFSTDWTAAGRNSYVMGFSPFDQVDRVIDFAASRGMRNIGALTTANAYGDAVLSAYRRSAQKNGIDSTQITRFHPNSADVATTLRRFTKYDERQNIAKQGVTIAGNAPIQSAPQVEVPYDAVFMPIGGNMARSVSNLLSQYDLRPKEVKRLGTGLWDDLSLATEAAMEGAWFASPDPAPGEKFRAKFAGIYGYEPPRLTTLAYDATALAGVLARKGFRETGRPAFDFASITNPNGFAGIDGIFRFNSNGVVERGLAVLEYRRGQIRVIDPAPKTFIKPKTYTPAATQQAPQTGHRNFRF